MELTLPHNYEPRPYQLPFLEAMDSGAKRAVLVWHRRAGKDKTVFNWVIKKLVTDGPILASYVFPTLKQGREILWEGIDGNGFRFIDHIPREILARPLNDSRMTAYLKNGSILRITGADHPDSLRGENATIYVLSEWAEMDPYVWGVIRPILAENNGVAIFTFTPKGENHAFDTYNVAKDNPNWFVQVLTVDDTKVIADSVLEQEKSEIIQNTGDDSLFQQEYYCSFTAAIQGAYYSKYLQEAESDGRITSVPYDSHIPVSTYWDIGVKDATAIWFIQTVGKEIHVIDYVEDMGEGAEHYIKLLSEKPYVYKGHNVPHDAGAVEFGTGKSTIEVARGLGFRMTPVPRLSIMDGINAVRGLLNRCWFDKDKCKRGLDALRNYRKDYNARMKTYNTSPLHDWASHGADAFRYFAVSHKEYTGLSAGVPLKAKSRIPINSITGF